MKNRYHPLTPLALLTAAIVVASPCATRALWADQPAQEASAAAPVTGTVGAAGLVATIDPETGQLGGFEVVEFNAEEMNALSTDSEDLIQVHHADGSVSMDLDGRFQTATIATVAADGTLQLSCVGSHEDARAVLCNHAAAHRVLEVK